MKSSIKVVVLGGKSVGKSTLTEAVLRGRAIPEPDDNGTTPNALTSTRIVKDIEIPVTGTGRAAWGMGENTGTVRLNLTDPSPTSIENIARVQDAVILLFDLTDRKSMDYIIKFKKELISNHLLENVPYFLVGNKEDLIDATGGFLQEEKQIKQSCKLNEIEKFYEISARTGCHVEDTIKDIVKRVAEKEVPK